MYPGLRIRVGSLNRKELWIDSAHARYLLELLVQVVNKVTSRSVGTEAFRVKSLAKVALVFRMTIDVFQIGNTMCKLALVSILFC